ncbi:MAG: response regulator [Gammaproteobacteria bacterium]|nr:response regulator [Gammaproteobacteria bacterium]
MNQPLIFDRLTQLYHDAHLQNLRADFHELDQHIASRRETVRIISRFPHMKQLMSGQAGPELDVVKERYTDWMNRLVFDRLDIVQVLYVDQDGNERLLMHRDPNTSEMYIEEHLKIKVDKSFLDGGIKSVRGRVITGPIDIDEQAGQLNPTRFINLQLITPVYEQEFRGAGFDPSAAPLGAVVINLDVSGLARVFRDILWVHHSGRYFRGVGASEDGATAFTDYPGLNRLFEAGNLGLWRGENERQAIWVPLFPTTDSGPLWVGRLVDSSPLDTFRKNLELRTAGIMLAMVVMIFIVAQVFANRAVKLQASFTDGIARMLDEDKPVTFDWPSPREARALAEKLTTLSERHAKNSGDLRDYARELEKTNRYKSEFLANVSHELRTPLNSILLLSKLLASEQQGLDDEQKQQARVINMAGQDLSQLINDILDLSKIEAGRLDLKVDNLIIVDLLNDIQDLFKPVTDDKGLELVVDIQASAPETLYTDADKLSQIVKNFMSNAIKFTAQGQVTLRLEKVVLDSRWPIRISVTDTGIGISKDKQELIFEAFQQADGSTSRRYGGTGLGLSISRKLTVLMGGRISVESQLGQGATFTIMLPERLETDEGDEQVMSERHNMQGDLQAEDTESIPIANYKGARILMVDDDMRNLLALTPVLKGWGLDVIAAGDGEEALETLAEESDVAVALLDVMMPGMDGLALAGAIREQSRFATLPCIGLSAKAGDDDRDRWLALGVGDYLVKPVDVRELHNVLSKVLNEETSKL